MDKLCTTPLLDFLQLEHASKLPFKIPRACIQKEKYGVAEVMLLAKNLGIRLPQSSLK